MFRTAALIPLALAVLAVPAGDAAAQPRPMQARTADERIKPIFDLPDAPPYRRGHANLDIGYLYRADDAGRVTPQAYREGRYVLYAGDRYLAVNDATLTLIEQNIGEDPLAAHYSRRESGEPAPVEPPQGAARSFPRGAPVWSGEGGVAGQPPARPVTVSAEDPLIEPDQAQAGQSGSIFQLDNRTLGAATALILLLVAGFRLAGAMRSVSARTGGRDAGAKTGAGPSRRRLPTGDLDERA